MRYPLLLWQYACKYWKAFWKWYGQSYKTARWYKRTGIILTTMLAAFILLLFLVDINFLWLFGKSPALSAIRHPEQNMASEIYSADGKLIGQYFRENRIPADYSELPEVLLHTLICTEDERFHNHFGIDPIGLFGAVKDAAGGDARGGSTITQQLVKNLFKTRTHYSTGLTGYIPGMSILVAKIKEWTGALKVEALFSKEEILTMYLNTVDFGNNAYGIKVAAKTYFNKTPDQLTVEECATLIGLLKATTYYNPRLNPENSLRRRNIVLSNLLRHNVISQQNYDSISSLPITLNYTQVSNYSGIALYFREAVIKELEDWCDDTGIDLYADGLKIYTTLDSRMQAHAEEAVHRQMRNVQRNFDNHWGSTNPWRDENHREIPNFIEDIAQRLPIYQTLTERFPDQPDSVWHYLNIPHLVRVFDYDKGTREMMMSTMDSIRYMERFMHTGFVAIEPQTGYVRAWVGDIDFNWWKYDKVTANRQPGSTFKLFVYTAAMNQGLSPCDTRTDIYRTYDANDAQGNPTKWAPRNADGVYSGAVMSLKAAMARSVNTIAVSLADEVGLANVSRTAHAMGINSPLTETPAMALGSSDVDLLELVNSYGTVINDGKRVTPKLVQRIEDKDGQIIYSCDTRQTEAIPYESAFLMQQMLLGGMTEPGGTSQALWGYDLHRYDTNFGGKTGTTSNHSDAWYVGVTQNLVAGAWVGGDYRCIHFRSGALGQGSRTALPIYAYFMENVLKDPALKQYRGKISTTPKQPIARSYQCSGIYIPVEQDTILNDPMLGIRHLEGIEDIEDVKDIEELDQY